MDSFIAGKSSVNEADLQRIFHLPPLLPKVPPLRVEYLVGTKVSKVDELDVDSQARASAGTYHFVIPEDSSAKVSQSVPAVSATTPPLNTISPKGPPPAKKK